MIFLSLMMTHLVMKEQKGASSSSSASENHVAEAVNYTGTEIDGDELLRQQNHVDKQNVTLFTLYRFATVQDTVLVIVGLVCGAVHGVAYPMFTLVVGGIVNNFNDFFGNAGAGQVFQSNVDHKSLYFVYIGIAMIGAAFIENLILVNRGELFAARYRKAYLSAVIHQNIAYFDKLGTGEITTRITNDTTSIQEAVSEKSGNVVQGVAAFVAALVVSFASEWKLACILLPSMFFVVMSMVLGSYFLIRKQIKVDQIYARGSVVAEEALSSSRNTVAFNLEDRIAQKFDSYLGAVVKQADYAGLSQGIMLACIWAAFFYTYALGLWEGSRLIVRGETSIGHVITVVMSMLIGSFQLGHCAPNIRFIVQGMAAAKSLNEAIDRVPVVNSRSTDGIRLEKVKGEIKLRDVTFKYPSRPGVMVLPNFSLDIPAGQTVALVGLSGSGKSTIVGLIERFYLPLSGSITLDGHDIEKFDVKWLRQRIGYVPQEPTLFAETIFDNIAYGLIGTEYENSSPEVKIQRVEEACKLANAWDFVQALTEKLDTNVGDRGFLLSGGQKQRIAIARAIVGNPPILLLDEATSALDTKSEGIVQDALDRAAINRTTIVIAHRLSTIKNAHKIVVVSHGKILEQGTHAELLASGGTYSDLVRAQRIKAELGDDTEIESNSSNNELSIKEDKVDVEEEQIDFAHEIIPGIESPVNKGLFRYLKMLWALNRSEIWLICGGTASAVILGYCYPSLGMVAAFSIQSIIEEKGTQMRHSINVYSGWLFFIGMMSLFSAAAMCISLSAASNRLVRAIRIGLFRQILRLDTAFFDFPGNTPGALTSILAKEAKAIDGLGGATLGQILQSFTVLIGGIVTGIPFNWRIGLVAMATVPIVMGCGFFRIHVLRSLHERARKVYEDSGALASQYASAVRTVQSLTREDDVVDKYAVEVDKQVQSSNMANLRSAVMFGLAEGLIPWVMALVFWWGSICMREGKSSLIGFYTVFMSIVLGAQSAGRIFSYAPDFTKAQAAAESCYRIFSAKPNIDVWDNKGYRPKEGTIEGNVDFNNVKFRYPTRPQVTVLRGLDLHITQGQYVALVGPSGCGKSTTIGLLERFYNPQFGKIQIDGINIEDYNLETLRSFISLVQQEPTLYSGTLKENIQMGWPGDPSEVTDQMIELAARKANIHDFISGLPDGYDTESGSQGGLLSGGQKQRVAIARALIRNPKILLLDEATSALDSDSERVVQVALDEAARGRTTIAIAHRLSTIQKADIIYVFEHGCIVEQGNHPKLMSLNGRYAELVRLQALET